MLSVGDGPVRVPKTAEVVAHAIRRSIVLGELQEGDSLPSEGQLLERFSVSRPILREALRILESESLIDLPRGTRAGATVHRPSRRVAARHTGLLFQVAGVTLAEVWGVTVDLIAPAAGAAARTSDRAGVERLSGVVAGLESLGDDPATFIERAAEFNAVLLELADNRAVQLLVGMMEDILRFHIDLAARDWRLNPAKARDPRSAIEGMRHLVELIRANHADLAETFWRGQLEDGARFFLDNYGSRAVVEIID
jgi:DNA-binding FadR family transcriptional regulator